uniref:Uncharacterized protein n=1 Tax=Roseihalotalea indica TaxID=2867963 RepID=A0AA49JDT1_9BACT|nr:hypothetical protein K4G66_28530 [Tunicatimonas sp. TK19036]
MKFIGSNAVLLIGVIMLLSACHRGMICPAFQSSFILDDSVRTVQFSLFEPDSSLAPKESFTDKGRYGIIEYMSYPKKYNSIKTVEMVTIFPPGEPVSQDSAYIDPLSTPNPLMAPVDSVNTPIISNDKIP